MEKLTQRRLEIGGYNVYLRSKHEGNMLTVKTKTSCGIKLVKAEVEATLEEAKVLKIFVEMQVLEESVKKLALIEVMEEMHEEFAELAEILEMVGEL